MDEYYIKKIKDATNGSLTDSKESVRYASVSEN